MKECFLLIIPFSLSLLTGTAVAQMAEPPFSRDELYRVTQFFVDEKKAAEAVDSLFENITRLREPSGSVQKHPEKLPQTPDKTTPGRPIAFEAVGGITFTDDTLILLSLLSSESEKKVNAYRQTLHKGGLTAEEQLRWQKRRGELESLPEVRRWRAKFGAP